MTQFHGIELLTPLQWSQAYPLVRLLHPAWSLASWLKRARALASRPSSGHGLMALCDSRMIVHGLFSYCVRTDILADGLQDNALRISNIAFVRLPGGHMEEAILRSAETLMQHWQCGILQFDMPFSVARQVMLDQTWLDQHHFIIQGNVFTRLSA